jgi:hypothetical protein
LVRFSILAIVLLVPAAFADTNYSTTAVTVRDTAAAINVGWYYDEVDAAGGASNNSNYQLDASWPGGWMGVTDNFIVGDTYAISIDGGAWQFTTFNGAQVSLAPIGDPSGDFGWTSADYSHGYFPVGAGAHSITLVGDGVGGVPAGLYARFDTVPEPATLACLALSALFIRRR